MPPECANFSHTEQVVVYMALPLLNKGYTIFMDSWTVVACTTIFITDRPRLVAQCDQTELRCLYVSRSQQWISQLRFDVDRCYVLSSRTKRTITC